MKKTLEVPQVLPTDWHQQAPANTDTLKNKASFDFFAPTAAWPVNRTPQVLPTDWQQQVSASTAQIKTESGSLASGAASSVACAALLLEYTINCNHQGVRSLLTKQHIGLLAEKADITDRSGRAFKQISAFEYALWAWDKNILITMIKCIPENEHNIKLYQQLLKQYNNLQKHGLTYILENKEYTASHFNFDDTIINALQSYINLLSCRDLSEDRLIIVWQDEVGRAQHLLPVYVVYEYYMNLMPGRQHQTTPITPTYRDYETNQKQDWYLAHTGIHKDYEFNDLPLGKHYVPAWCRGMVIKDLNAITQLKHGRVREASWLPSHLQTVIDAWQKPDAEHCVQYQP